MNESHERDTSRSVAEAAARYGVDVPPDALPRLEEYCGLVWEWNRKLNLTRHTDFDTFVVRDVVDSVQLARWLEPKERILDVGSGGGVPGLLLAILRPDLETSLSESIGKKAAALEAMARSLGLAARIHGRRAEDLLAEFRFDALTARAVGPLWKILKLFRPHWPSIGRFYLIKGPRWTEEQAEARQRGLLRGVELRRVAEYATPGTGARNVILQLSAASRAKGP